MKYLRELITGGADRTLVFGPMASGSARYISEHTYARSAMASVELERVSYVLGYGDIINYMKKCKAFKGVPVGFSV
jgi:hypothetical protein